MRIDRRFQGAIRAARRGGTRLEITLMCLDMVFAFGEFELDVALCELRRNGERVPLQPKVLDTLRYLVEHRERVVTKQEMIDALWEGARLNEIAVPWSISHTRKALGQSRGAKGPIETVRRRGYRFVAPVRVRPDMPLGASLDVGSGNRPTAGRATEPFLGRDDVMGKLTFALSEVQTRGGRLVLITGEAGIGKTRCANELASIARSSGVGVWVGRCMESNVAPAFWLWIQILRECIADPTVGSTEQAEAKKLLARLGPAEGAPGDPSEQAAGIRFDAARFWLLDGLSHCVRKTAEKRPRVLVLEDLHAADEGSLEVLSMLAPELVRSKLLVIGTSREGVCVDAGPVARKLKARLRPSEAIALSGLGLPDIARYLCEMTGQEGSSELTRAVYAKTAGNPLFLKEAVHLLAARGETMVRPEDVRMPQAARGFLGDRLAKMTTATRMMLDAASVAGDAFDIPLLSRVTRWPPAELLPCLDEAIAQRFIEQEPNRETYAFLHGLMREVLLDGLSHLDRVRLHGQAALALESAALRETNLSELAYQFHRALPAHHEKAAHYGWRAGNAAMQVFAYDDASKFYGWALAAHECAPQGDGRRRCEILLASALASRLGGHRDESLAQFRRVIELARHERFADLLVEAARHLRPTVLMARLPDPLVRDVLEDALRLLPEGAKAARAETYSRLACVPPYACSIEESQRLSLEAVRLAREVNHRELLLEALVSRFHALSGPDSSGELLRTAEEILRLAGPTLSRWSAEVFVTRHFTFLQRGEMGEAEDALSAFGRAARELHLAEAGWHCERLSAQQQLHAGEFAYAEARFGQLAIEGDRLNLEYAPLFYARQMNLLSVERTGAPLPTAIDYAVGVAWKAVGEIPSYQADRISVLLYRGRATDARAALRSITAGALAGITRDRAYLYTLAKLAVVAVALGERDIARVLYEALCVYPTYNPMNGLAFCLGSASHYLGRLAQFLGRAKDAETHFEEANVMNARIGYRPHALRSQLALAGLLAESSSTTRRERANFLASQVRAAASDLGMRALADEATLIAVRVSTASGY